MLPIETEDSRTLWTSVSIDAVTPIFFILIIGITLAMVLMFLERQTVGFVQWSGKRNKSGRGKVVTLLRRMPS
jgi:hypothetical protein